jgi:hypothetical protein
MQCQPASDLLEPLFHARQSEARAEHGGTLAIIARSNLDAASVPIDFDLEFGRVRMAHRIGDDFLHAAKQHFRPLRFGDPKRLWHAEDDLRFLDSIGKAEQ